MIKYLLLSLVVLLVLSCKKDDVVDVPYLFSGTYSIKRVEFLPVRLFTSKGEILDTSVVREFVFNNKVSWDDSYFKSFVFKVDNVIPPDKNFYIAFSANNQATVYYSGTQEMPVVAKVFDGVTYLESLVISSDIFVFSGNSFPDYSIDYSSYISGIFQYSPLYVNSTIIKSCIYLEGDSLSLRLPKIIVIRKRANSSIVFSANNNIKADFVKELLPNDTLAYQIRYEVLEK